MTDFVSTWNSDSFLTYPVGPLGLIAMHGTEELGEKVNQWLLKWRSHTEDVTAPGDMRTAPGLERQDFLIKVHCPRFGNGEGKGMIKESVRGYDIYILCDVGAYNCTYDMYGQKIPMSPDDHFMDLKRIIAAIGGKAKRINVIMPMLYEGRQHRRSSRESLDCAMALQDLERMGRMGVICEFYPQIQAIADYAGKVGMIEEKLGAERGKGYWNRRKMLDSGVVLSGATDLPLMITDIPEAIYHGCGGYFPEGGEPFNKENTITIPEMLKAWTRGGAYNLGMEEKLGTLEEGKLADIAVLDKNVFEVSMEQMRDVTVAMTMTNGRITYRK